MDHFVKSTAKREREIQRILTALLPSRIRSDTFMSNPYCLCLRKIKESNTEP